MDNCLFLIASPAGRLTRVTIGTLLIAAGLAQGRKGWVLVTVGLLPLSMGAFDWCLLVSLEGLPFEGPQLREVLGSASVEADPRTNLGSYILCCDWFSNSCLVRGLLPASAAQ